MKSIRDIFQTVIAVSHWNSDKTLKFSAMRINSAFEITVTDAVTEDTVKTFFIGEMKNTEFNDRLRWAIVEKKGSKIRCLKKSASSYECLNALNALLKPLGSNGFSLTELISVVETR